MLENEFENVISKMAALLYGFITKKKKLRDDYKKKSLKRICINSKNIEIITSYVIPILVQRGVS